MAWYLKKLADVKGKINKSLQQGEKNIGSAVNQALSQAQSSFTGGVRQIQDGTSNTLLSGARALGQGAQGALQRAQGSIPTDQYSRLTNLGQGGLAGAPKLLTDHLSEANRPLTEHVTNIFQTKGFSPEGARQLVQGELPADMVDRTILGAFGSREVEEVTRGGGLFNF